MADKRVKMVKKILQNPKNVSFEDVDRLLSAFEYVCGDASGSHFTFRKVGCNPITVPKRKPVREVYIKNIIRILDLESWYEQNG